jgi:hypothetical protein
MITILLITLIVLDVALIGVVIALSRRQSEQGSLLSEMTEERRMISDLRASIKEELSAGQGSLREALERMTRLAAEADQEVRQGTELLTKEVDSIISQLASKFEDPMRELTRKQHYVESLLKKVETEKAILQKVLARGEKLVQIFDKKIPYEEVISELEDKKYTDARFMLSRGMPPAQVARELGMSETEVRLVAGLSGA